ncbi:TPR-like protein [Rhizoctonia solani]|uniref:TPR-like protein n=1 Tax=Rhizoctonia solani TaxID=456999 RepID=A0A8H7LZI7_9AGAM|nr:TPR-like protein [Rhizoctonia solani]
MERDIGTTMDSQCSYTDDNINHASKQEAETENGPESLKGQNGSRHESERFDNPGESDVNVTPFVALTIVDRKFVLSIPQRSIRELGELIDIEKTIEYLSRAVALTDASDLDLPGLLNNLVKSHCNRYARQGGIGDIERLIEHCSRLVALAAHDDPELPMRLAGLGGLHEERYRRLGQLDDIDKAIEYESRAVILVPDDHPLLPQLLSTLAVSHRERFSCRGYIKDLDNATEYAARSVELTSSDHPALPERFADLGICYGIRFRARGNLDDNDRAIEHLNHALSLAPDDYPNLSGLFINLGVVYGTRFNRLGELNDLDKAVEFGACAVSLTPDGHPRLPERLVNLGVSYGDRFKRLAESSDIDKAIKLKSRAIALTPDGDPHLPYRLSVLGASYHDRFSHQGSQEDLDNAIGNKARAVELTPDGHSELSGRLAALGSSYGQRFKLLRNLNDIEKSIEYLSRAVILTPEDDPHLLDRHLNLGIAYNIRYRSVGRVVDLEKAIEHTSHALALAPEDHPIFTVVHHLLAVLCVSEYRVTDNSLRLQDALCSYRKASQSQAGSPRCRFGIALEWANDACIYSSLNVIEAYQTAIDILPQYIWLGTTTDQRYRDMEGTKSLPAKAASAAIATSNYGLALEWLEHARCVVWNQSLMLRSPLDELRSSNQTLADRLQEVASQLDTVSSEHGAPQKTASDSSALKQASMHHLLAHEYNDLLDQIRRLHGFEDFLQPMKINKLVHAARNGPIAVINIHKARCDVLIAQPGKEQIDFVPLPIQRDIKLRPRPRQEQDSKDNFGAVLKLLWYSVVKPILDFLGHTNIVPPGDLPHITWCSTGIVSFLPLHAAGDYDQPNSRVYKYTISSYTPTLTALISCSPTSLTPGSQILGVGQKATPIHGLDELPGTSKELAYIKEHTKRIGYVGFSESAGDEATIKGVLDAMDKHDWVHLACHAYQSAEDPSESGFLLHDGILNLASINLRSFKNKGLAFLSACQTATGDARLPDEAIHLASGMLMAGYTSVIGTMWSVKDIDAPLVAEKVYAKLLKEGKLGNGEAGKALHSSVANCKTRLERWNLDAGCPTFI